MRWGLAILLVVAALADSARGCRANDVVEATSSIAFDGQRYAIAWANSEQRGATVVYAHRFAPADFVSPTDSATTSAPVEVLRVRALASTPEIVSAGSGSLVFGHTGDKKLWAVAFDPPRVGRPVLVDSAVDIVCVRPAKDRGKVVVAYAKGSKIALATLDSDGAVTKRESFPAATPDRCAMASGDGRLAIVAESTRGGPTLSSQRALLVQAPRSAGPLRISRASDGWAVLRAGDRGLQVDYISDTGKRREGRRLPAVVDAPSVDLARNDRGLFVTWVHRERSGKDVSWMFLADREIVSVRTAGNAVGTRAIGHQSSCAITWTAKRGSSATVLRIADCGVR